jgi:hypothetical protein
VAAATAELLEVELAELSLEVDELEAELAVEALLAELAESALCSATSRLCRSLLSLAAELDGGGRRLAGGGPPLEPLVELADDAEVALELKVEPVVWLAASNCCSSCHVEAPLAEPTDPMDMPISSNHPYPRRWESRLIGQRKNRVG